MITDALLLLDAALAVADTSVTDDAIDLLGAGREVFSGRPLHVLVTVNVDVGGTGDVTLLLVTDDAVALDSNTDVQTLGVIPNSAVAGDQYVFAINPLDPTALLRYVGVEVSQGGSATGATFQVELVQDADVIRNYPRSSNIDFTP